MLEAILIDQYKKYNYLLLCENLLFKSQGIGFQFEALFNKIMTAKLKDKFQSIRHVRDEGNDGYIPIDRHYYALYSPIEIKEKNFVEKLKKDFNSAIENWEVLKWTFTYNSKEGISPEIAHLLDDLREKNNNILIDTVNIDDILINIVSKLDEDELIAVFGIMPGIHDFQNVTPVEINEILNHIASRDQPEINDQINEVPINKLEFNSFSKWLESKIVHDLSYTNMVKRYLQDHPDVEFGDKIATILTRKYNEIKTNNRAISSDYIYLKLEEFIGNNINLPNYRAAVHIIIAYFLERCDIFESPLRL